ncbi:MAG: DUF2461 family protein, partial [Actinomycetota bacterium]|nr:DUF2461 family protein [Actinomycetota bacterium]
MAQDLESFAGFGPDTVSFLAGLEADNCKGYFDANRRIYDDQVRRPLQQLCVAVGGRLAAGSVPEIRYEPKVGRSMFRINRDLRFSKDSTPYHPYLDLAWWSGDHPKTSPAFIMRIRHDELLTGVGVFALIDDRLARYRAAVVGEPGVELERVVAT